MKKKVEAYEKTKNVIGLDGHWYRIEKVRADFKYKATTEITAQERYVHEALMLKEALDEAGVLIECHGVIAGDLYDEAKEVVAGYDLLVLKEITLPPRTVLIPVDDDESTMEMRS